MHETTIRILQRYRQSYWDETKHVLLKDAIPKPVAFPKEDTFFAGIPSDISIQNPQQMLHLTMHFEGHEIQVFLALYDKKKVPMNKWMNDIYRWFYYVFRKWSHLVPCSVKELTIYLFLTDYKKQFTSTSSIHGLRPLHVNSGHSYSCRHALQTNRIMIYRKEEWFKVLIHESYHALGLDWAAWKETKLNIHRWFPLVSENATPIFLYETFTEFWSEIWYCLVKPYSFKPETRKRNPFFAIEIQRQYAINQAIKILKMHMHSDYLRFIQGIGEPYLETTPILAYHILKAIAMIHFDEWIALCQSIGAGQPIFAHSLDFAWPLFEAFFKAHVHHPKTIKILMKKRTHGHSLRMLSPALD